MFEEDGKHYHVKVECYTSYDEFKRRTTAPKFDAYVWEIEFDWQSDSEQYIEEHILDILLFAGVKDNETLKKINYKVQDVCYQFSTKEKIKQHFNL